MGSAIGVICNACDARFVASRGGGFFFHLLHCARCGKEKFVGFDELGDAHLRYVKGLAGPWTIATRSLDEHIQENVDIEAIDEQQYDAIVESKADPCDCGGRFSLKASPRCPQCLSSDFRDDPEGSVTMYD